MSGDQLVQGMGIQKEIHTLTEHRKVFLAHARVQQFRDQERPESGYGRRVSSMEKWDTPMTLKIAGNSSVTLFDDFITPNWEEFTDLYIMRLDRRVLELEKKFNQL